ncbi:MAG TPA: hypothetical protein VIN61_14980 [Gammaproteobacteria bacterium]
MSTRQRELANRRAELELRCAAQRRALAREVRGIEARLELYDRGLAIARTVVRHPAGIAAVAVALWALGRAGGARVAVRGLLLAAAARRLAGALLRP